MSQTQTRFLFNRNAQYHAFMLNKLQCHAHAASRTI